MRQILGSKGQGQGEVLYALKCTFCLVTCWRMHNSRRSRNHYLHLRCVSKKNIPNIFGLI